ncbi:hypothetical protein [Amycolatopsis sp. NPDC051903]|uniref:hypothetical protein n=1 Tax=Amycolatopsis sp. NPDC051903 TaxID=3363936 RepID=UPI0037AF8A2B
MKKTLTRLEALVPALILVGLLVSVLTWFASPTAHAGTALPVSGVCLPDQEVAKARALTGEHETNVDWVDRAQAKAWDMANAAAWALPKHVTIVMDTPCEYVAGVAAHEFAHEAQFRKAGGSARAYTYYGPTEIEKVAQCYAVLTGFKAYKAYGVGKASDCSEYELVSAESLRAWAR